MRAPLLFAVAVLGPLLLQALHQSHALSMSLFHGTRVLRATSARSSPSSSSWLVMRKQKASDRRTRRMQRGGETMAQEMIRENLQRTVTGSSLDFSAWGHRGNRLQPLQDKSRVGGRGRSRKRSTLYNSLSSYHNKFLMLLTKEYRLEEEEVVDRIKFSVDNPLALESSGHALFDLYPERRGDQYTDEIYRLVKAKDATTAYPTGDKGDEPSANFPPNHKFTNNDVILITQQLHGSGDFFDPSQLPTGSGANSIEARVIGSGPTYIDCAINTGAFEAAFGPAPNNRGPTGRGDSRLRLRADRFFTNVPYVRMVAALTQLTAIPDCKKAAAADDDDAENIETGESSGARTYDKISIDETLKELIIATHSFTDPESPFFHDLDVLDLQDLSRRIAKPPMPTSMKMANQALSFIQKNPTNIFPEMNGPQLSAIGAALSRKVTLIQGPPGTGKTTVASTIGFGFTHQCRSLSPHSKVLGCAFSNVGADNLAEGFLKLGLKVVRIGKASATSSSLRDYTLDAAIDRDPDARKALKNAARATAQLARIRNRRSGDSVISEQMARDIATAAVKLSKKACNIAATRALREADVVVSTSIGASNPYLQAASGFWDDDDQIYGDGTRQTREIPNLKKRSSPVAKAPARTDAPDGLPPLTFPFVIIDEACQSIEPATLIPIISTNSCRSLVMLGDPCQLPATVRDDASSILSVSLMERLAATLPQPVVSTQPDKTEKDTSELNSLPIKQARSMLQSMNSNSETSPYRKRFSGSLLLSVQYRMHPTISAFSSAIFYDGLLSTPTFLKSQRSFPVQLHRVAPCSNPDMNVRWVDVGGQCNERRGLRKDKSIMPFSNTVVRESTYRNEKEAEQIMTQLRHILREPGFGVASIGIITPYSGQVQLIQAMVSADNELQLLMNASPSVSIEVNSVDGYQGRERDVIIFSAVRSNRRGDVGFLSDWRRMNVALTRARMGLVIVGDKVTLSEGDKHWASFLNWCEGVSCIVDGPQSKDGRDDTSFMA